jgi:hypothetical protein
MEIHVPAVYCAVWHAAAPFVTKGVAGNEESREGETLGAGRLVGAVLAEQTDEWAGSGRHYMSLAVIAKTLAPLSTEAMLEVTMVAA